MRTHLISLALRVALLTSLLWAAHPTPALAGGEVTDCSSDAQFSSLLALGGTITFNCGAGPHTIPISSQKSINATTTIDGGGTITLDGQHAYRLFDVGALLTLRNIVLTGGYFNGDGGAIRNTSAGTLILESSTIRDSSATLSGGAILSTGPLTITNSVLEGNQALNGGALYPRFAGARTVIVGSVLRNNAATDRTNGWGGALLAWDGAPVTIEGSDIYSNIARDGGAIYNFANSMLTLRSNTRLRTNVATLRGGGVYNAGTASLSDVTLSGNSADNGGGVYNDGMATLINVTLSDNSANADGYGGGLLNNGTATLANVTLSGNSANFVGGGVYNSGTATLTDVTLSGNSARSGGGIYNSSGGGISNTGGINTFGSTAMLTNVTLSGNSAIEDGGGVYNVGTATLANVTLSGNSANHGGGISQNSGSVSVNDTIVANSPSGGNCDGAVTNSGFNLASDSSCGFGSGRDNVNVMLGPLANNGGPTLTHLPQAGSPAIDGGSGCPATDQRGATRPVGPACDIGAVEAGALLPLVYSPLALG